MSATNTQLEFDEVNHVYTLGDVEIPSVTQLMSKFEIVDTKWYDLQASIRGRHVHTATEYYDEGDLDIQSLDPIVKPFVDAYIKFRKELKLEYLLSEKQMVDHVNLFAGTLDRLAIINGKIALIDIKSGSMPKWVAIQLEGYRRLLKAMGLQTPVEFYALVLRKDGTYRFNKIPTMEMIKAKRIFDSMLTINNFINQG